jgi:transcriptional regulator with XRE-family HTH domain
MGTHPTLRDLGKLSEVDHAYIHRLETGEKAAPSDDTVKALTKALKLDSWKARILKFLVTKRPPAQSWRVQKLSADLTAD